jgi:hypothetical protein
MKFNLTLVQRLSLLNNLPEKGTFITLKIVRKLRESLSLSEEEIKYYNIHQEGNNVTWDNTKSDEVKEIEIGEKALDIIKDTLKKLDENKELSTKELDLYEMFVENTKEE